MMIRVCVFFLVASADQAIKWLIRSMPQGHVFFRVDGILEIVSCVNTGAAFSMLSGHPLMLSCVSVLLILGVGWFIRKHMHLSPEAMLAVSCLLGGGIGNLLDRVFFGGVTDYIRLLFIRFPVFNLADIAIVASAAFLLFLLLINRLETHSGEAHGE